MASPKVNRDEFTFDATFDFSAPRRSPGSPESRHSSNTSLSPSSITKTSKEGEEDYLLTEKNDAHDVEKALPSHLNAQDNNGSKRQQAQFLVWTAVNTLATIGIVCDRCYSLLGSHR